MSRQEHFAAGATGHTVPITGGRKVTVRPGVIDDAAKTAYTQGQCHALALAMHERGYQIGAVHDNADEHGMPVHPVYGGTHYFAYDPSSKAHGIDIHGRRPLREIVEGSRPHGGHGEGYDHPQEGEFAGTSDLPAHLRDFNSSAFYQTHSPITDPHDIATLRSGVLGGLRRPHMTAARQFAKVLAPKVR